MTEKNGQGCPYAGRCGGCQMDGVPYEDQLRIKEERVRKLLKAFGPVRRIAGMRDPAGYRCKVHAVIAKDKKGRTVSGIYARGTHRVVPVRGCRIEDPRADAVIRTVTAMADEYRIPVFDEDRGRGWLRHVLIRTAPATGQMMVTLVAASREFRDGKRFIGELTAKHPEITSVVLNINSQRTNMVLGRDEKVLYGPGTVEDILLGKRFRISSGSFYQVNPRQTEILYQKAIEACGLTGRETLLDAYCGTGTIGLCAADKARAVTGVELNPDAVRDARENARINGIKNAKFICADAGRYMTALAGNGRRPDVVIMDPPRTGSDARFLKSLLELAPPRVVYVSCNPETLARDLALLRQGGYRMEYAVPVDMFPYTEHVETVCCLYHQKKDFITIPYEPKYADFL